ncbi:MAG: hypothetical protein ACE5JL_16490 [Dehalococcoidia bacterium]
MLRDKSTCEEVLRQNDATTLDQRSERLAALPVITLRKDRLPSRSSRLRQEAIQCFVNGYFNGCVAVLAMAVEYALRRETNARGKPGLKALVVKARKLGVLDEEAAEVFLRLNCYRNKTVHSRLSSLASDVVLQKQEVVITERGVMEKTAWREFNPEDDFNQDLAAAFREEQEVLSILLDVRRTLYRLFAEVMKGEEPPTDLGNTH